MHPYDLRCEYLKNPLGIDVSVPRFFWKLETAGRDATQSARRIQMASDECFRAIIWDSEKVQSGCSVHVEYGGPALQACTRYFWRVQVWDGSGASAGWSEPAWFETGRMGRPWKARWISAGYSDGNTNSPLLRSEFNVDGPVRSARVYATARGLYRLWLNGSPVGDWLMTPGWTSYRKRLQYQTYDITPLLRKGANAVGAMLGRGWHDADLGWVEKERHSTAPMELLMELCVVYEDGREQTLQSGEGWETCESALLYSEIYHGETYDARREIQGWSEAGRPCGDWWAVFVAPEGDTETVMAQDGLPVRRIGEIAPVRLFTTGKGERVLDFGQNMVGFVRFRVRGCAGGRVVLRHFEVLDSDGNVYTDNLRRARQTVEYILKGGAEETFEPFFTFQGFQYVHIAEWPGEPGLSDFTGVVVHSDMEETGSFSCNDAMINQLQHNIVWGQKGNFLDVPTDCPQRDERLGWTGDAQVFIPTACFNYMTAPFYTKWLRDMAADQLEDGGIPFVIPAEVPGDSSAAWGDAATICPWTVYEYYGDRRLLEECYPMMKRWVEHIRAWGSDEYLWDTGMSFQYGDWLGLDAGNDSYFGATSVNLIATAYYALSAQLLARAADALDYREDAPEYWALYRNIRGAFNEEFVTPDGRLVSRTQTAYVLALRFGLLDEAMRDSALEELKALLNESGGHLTTGFLGTPHICHVLTDNGMHEEACKLVMKRDYPSWLYPITKGATTMWEHWDGLKPDGSFWSHDMNSFNHYAYGSIGDWLYRNILGIAPDISGPGFQTIRIGPKPNGMFSRCEGALNTLYGEVSIRWEQSGSVMRLEVSVPANASAMVTLPSAVQGTILESGIPLENADGIDDVVYNGSEAAFVIGSGKYSFQYQYAQS